MGFGSLAQLVAGDLQKTIGGIVRAASAYGMVSGVNNVG